LDDQPIDPKLPYLILRVLGKGLSDDPVGQKLLARFRRSARKNAKALTDHLNQRLSTDQAFRERLAQEPGLSPDMRATIYGGRVDRLIQIAEAGTVNIFLGMPIWMGLSAVIIAVIAVGALVLTLIPKPLPPMGNGFNVAVAEFAMLAPNGHTTSSDISRQFSDGLFTTIENETKLLPTALRVELRGPKDVGIVTNDDMARTTAERLNATILIYGRVESDTQGFYRVEPRFYVRDTTFSYGSEVTGPTYLGQPITKLTLNPDGQFNFNTRLNARTQALLNIVQGLAYFSIHRYDIAETKFQDAVNTPNWEAREGQEVAYLLLGTVFLRSWDLIQNPEPLPKAADAFNKAYELNQNYFRSYLGLGAVAVAEARVPNDSRTGIGEVDKDKLIEGINWYAACLNQTQPPQAYIPTKAAFGLGQAYLLSYEFHVIEGSRELALKHFQEVIEKYQTEQIPDLAWFAAHAHAGLGRLAGLDSDWKTMSDEYREAIRILEGMQPNLPKLWIARYWSYVAFAEEKQNHQNMAHDAYERAIEVGSGIVGEEELGAWQDALEQIQKEKS
jgi:hypothetical protein